MPASVASWESVTCVPAPTDPRQNGKAERFIQTMLREWAYGRAYGSSAERRLNELLGNNLVGSYT